jgi:putative ABC transport system permease protein
MIKNVLRIALRNFRKDKWFSLINILGLTIGITFSLFLIFYVRDELNYDRFNTYADRIYRIVTYVTEKDKNTNFTYTEAPLAFQMKKDYPEVQEAARMLNRERTLFKVDNKSFFETKAYYADSNIFKIFTARFLEGNPNTALIEPNSVVINKTTADKYFGKNVPAVGKTLRTVYDLYKVTGVFEDIPENTHIRYNMLISMSSDSNNYNQNWGNFNYFTYALLRPGTSQQAFQKKVDHTVEKFVKPVFDQFGVKMRFYAEPIVDIHLHSDLEREPEELGSMSYIWTFSAVAFFMLLIACINYMNLTTARSARRAKEIGIRKVTGSGRGQLIAQFLGESVLTAMAAVVLSFILIVLLFPVFNSISGKSFSIANLLQPFNILLMLSIGLFTGLIGGSYPAFYLSAFQPVSILKGALSKASGNINLRRTLVVLQFSISMVMLICTWIVYSQLEYMRNKDLGFDRNQVITVVVNTGKYEPDKIIAMGNDFRRLSSVADVGVGGSYPGSGNTSLNLFRVQTKTGHVDKGIECYGVDAHYFSALGIKVVAGRNFEPADTSHGTMVNQSFAKHFGWDQPIGQRITFPGDTSVKDYLEVVGVVKDFNQNSLYNPIQPLLFFYGPLNNTYIMKLKPGNSSTTLAQVEGVWKKYFPALPFEFKFLDEGLNSQYVADQKRGKIFASLAVLTIMITCLGLLGLTAYTTQQRQKEISVRRVLGANVGQIITLITRNYFWLALIAAAIAFPVAWYFMSNWLKVFSYSPGISAIPFILSALLIIITAILTATFHSAKAALSNPSKNLRTE